MARKLIKGCEAIGEAAVQAGCKLFFGYPITPQTEIIETIAHWIDTNARRMGDFNHVFVPFAAMLAGSVLLLLLEPDLGTAIVMITHTPWLVAEYARRVVLMRGGRRVFDGGVREFFAHDAMLRASSFRAPEVTALSRRFGTVALTAEEMAAWLKGQGG